MGDQPSKTMGDQPSKTMGDQPSKTMDNQPSNSLSSNKLDTSMDCLECKVCKNLYDEEHHRPRSSLCGHELCTSCIKELIIDNRFVCPTCRQTYSISVPEDLPINFGLMDVKRTFEKTKIHFTEERKRTHFTEERKQTLLRSTVVEVCIIHDKAIDHRCEECRMWICQDCLESHLSSGGCSIISLSKAMDNMTEKHNKHTDMLLATFEEDANYIATKIKEHANKEKKYMQMAEKHGEEMKKLHNLLEQGNIQKTNLLESQDNLNKARSPSKLSERVDVMKRRQQSLRSWSVKYLGTDSPFGLPKALREKKNVFTERIINNEKSYAKLLQQGGDICFHSFKTQPVDDDSVCITFDRVQRMIYEEASLVFLELSREDVVKGRVLMRLDKDLPNIRNNMLMIVTGHQGESLRGKRIYSNRGYDIENYYKLPFSKIPVTLDCREKSTAMKGDVIGYFRSGYLSYIYFYLASSPLTQDYGEHYCVIGNIEKGLDVMQECSDEYKTSGAKWFISDCGIVLEQE